MKTKLYNQTLSRFARGFFISALLGVSSLSAAVTNGDFETGDFSGWTKVSPFDQYLFVTGTGPTYGSSHSGSSFAVLGGFVVPFDSITQSVATTAGLDYDVSFWLRTNGDTSLHPDEFKATFGNIILLDDKDRRVTDWTKYSFIATATSASTELEFAAAIGDTYWALDDVSVVAHNTGDPVPSSAVPEPSTYAYWGGLVLLGLVLRKRVRALRTG